MNSELAFANTGATWLLTWSWQALLILTVVWLMLKLSRVKSATVRHHLWLAGLLSVALLPICSLLASRLPTRQSNDKPVVYWLEVPLELTTSAPVTAAKAVPEKISVAATDWHYLLGPLTFLAWALGTALAFLQFGLGVYTTHQLRCSARRASFEELDCGFTHSARVGLSVEAQSPMLTGVLRPLILLPADILHWTNQAERRAMLQHELAHLERRDHYVNALQSLLSAVFFFHPIVRFACRQMTLERELACDDRVVSLGADSVTYAESILKVAERNLLPRGLHQPAFFSTKQFLERRLTMILNPDRSHTIRHAWRYLLLPVGLIAVIAVLLVSGNVTSKGQNPPAAQDVTSKDPNSTATQDDDLVERAVSNPDLDVRLAALKRLALIKGERGSLSLTEVYQRSDHAIVKEMVIHHLGTRGEISALTAIGQVEGKSELGYAARNEITNIMTRKTEAFREQNPNIPPPPPPPPPPPMRVLPRDDYEFEVIGKQERTLLKPLGFNVTHIAGKQTMKMKLPAFAVLTPQMAYKDGAFYALDRFEIELTDGHKLYGVGTLRVLPKKDSIEYSLTTHGGIYLDADHTQKVGLSEFLK
ncbi:MAG: M56 family metallopeptidase [Acidobacteria bacterium]|nr:M56 family metallopeptidase [Acidobacteriota bacterium]